MKNDKLNTTGRDDIRGSEGLMDSSEWDQLQHSLRDMVDGESENVRPEFMTDNILRAVRSSASGRTWLDEVLADVVGSWFRPVVLAGILLILMLAAYNAQHVASDLVDRSTTERVLGLHPITVASAYDLDLESITR